MVITEREYSWKSRWEQGEERQEGGQAVVKLCRDETPDGSSRDVVEYKRSVIDSEGREIGVILVFDLRALCAGAG
jgi:hypothetical protein